MKKIISLLVIALLSIGLITSIGSIVKAASSPGGTDVYGYGSSGVWPNGDFQSTHNYSYSVFPGTPPKWNFSIYIENVPDCQLVSVNLNTSDFTKAKIVNYYSGWLCNQPGWSLAAVNTFNATDGSVNQLYTNTAGALNITTGVEAFKIEVEGYGFTPSTTINITDCYVSNLAGDVIGGPGIPAPQDDGHNVIFTQYFAPPPPPTAPVASFTMNTTVHNYENDTIHFDATASTPGYDGNASAPITFWQWDFGDLTPLANLTSTPDHKYTTAGIYTVTLTVFAPSANVNRNMTYDTMNTGTVSHGLTIEVFVLWAGLVLDLYSDNWRYPGYWTNIIGNLSVLGQGNGTEFDSYSPQELVCLYAKLTYNGQPIVNKEVEFEVNGPINTFQNITIYRQAATDVNGIATICFRIPWPADHSEQIVFGDWTVIAKGDVAQTTISEVHTFYVGWIMTISSEAVDPNPVHRGTYLYVYFAVYNHALTPRNFTFTATLYDNLSVAVGSATLVVNNVPPGNNGPYMVGIFVPNWAYVGPGATVYKDLFTKEPWLCGVCWSPEQSETLTIIA